MIVVATTSPAIGMAEASTGLSARRPGNPARRQCHTSTAEDRGGDDDEQGAADLLCDCVEVGITVQQQQIRWTGAAGVAWIPQDLAAEAGHTVESVCADHHGSIDRGSDAAAGKDNGEVSEDGLVHTCAESSDGVRQRLIDPAHVVDEPGQADGGHQQSDPAAPGL